MTGRAMGRLAGLGIAATLAVSGALLPAGQADAVPTSTVQVAMPGPGHSSSWSSSVANPGGSATDAYLSVTALGGSVDAFGGLLTTTVSLSSGRIVIPETPVADLLDGAPVNVGPVAAGTALTVRGTVSLAREAGDGLQGLSATIVFQLSSIEAPSPQPPITLPGTGSTIATAAIAVAVVAIVVGGILIVARRKRKKQQ